jgi:hypothetical protein
MTTFVVHYEVTERYEVEVSIEAETEQEALRMVSEYETADTEGWVFDSIEYSRDNVRLCEIMGA